ncbi:glycosyltransferase family 8 protein [Streptococcus oralis]|uniref:Glycosyltransferase family 8 protein n=1 Tax=Streptococcus oralis TaxID=1303 RepID=A0A7T2ZXU9_STROR|nr:glycosyltransferase family 8 protein [Streptococcus oralis]QPT02520.1 glycosyltransferase family 8 protein [Streptococcus oralis]CAK1608140.1 Glycosyltransferase family 8 protein [Streptococcus oralis subsp. dentisani]
MNIVYATDNNFVDVLCASIKSLYTTNSDLNLNLWIIADNVFEKNKEKVNNLSKQYAQKEINWIENIEIPFRLHLDRGSISSFSRLFLGSVLPNTISEILYLDSDIIVMNSLKSLLNIDFGNKILYGVNDTFNKEYKKVLDIPIDKDMFNAGVMFIDLEKWRNNNIEEKLLQVIQKFNGTILQGDLGVLNAVLYNSFGVLPPEYNYMTIFEDMSYEEMITFKKPINYYSKEEIQEARDRIVLRHFTTSFLSKRPWQEGSTVAHIEQFKKYYEGSYNAVKESLLLKVFQKLPKKSAVFLLGFIQSKIRPKLYRILK